MSGTLYGTVGGILDQVFCDQCGAPAGEGEHTRCASRRELEPPRYCADCARRMVVQVTPTGWTARCSRHGERDSAAAHT